MAGAVVSPAPECVVGFGSTRMLPCAADVVPSVASDLCWACSVGGGSVAELAHPIGAPAPECVVGFGGACLICAQADVVPCIASHLCGCISFGGTVNELTSVIPLGGCPNAELTHVIESPTPKRSIRFGSAGMSLAGLDGVPGGPGNLSWDI